MPACHISMMTADENIWHGFPTKDRGTCILWAFQQAGFARRVAILLGSQSMAQNAGQQSCHCINDRQGSRFTATENKITDTEFIRNQLRADPFIHAFVAPAHESQTGMGTQFFGNGLIETTSLGCEQDDGHICGQCGRLVWGPYRKIGRCIGRQLPAWRSAYYRFNRTKNRFRLHNHATAATIGIAITDVMPICCVVTNIMKYHLQDAMFLGPGQNAF